MGATRVCPGTHLCGEDQSDMCAVHGFQPLRPKENDGDQTPVWKQGDAVIFNQQMAHHGEGHASGPDRVMFVASFTNRPRLALDSRVLSAGLFSFSLWNIWGLTWKDLYQNATYTGNPLYRKLRSLGLWKPADANWGLDFITKSVMEWNMGENGMEPDTLERYARRIHSYLGLPTFLQGRVIEVDEDAEEDLEEDPYHTFFDTTIQTWSDFFIKANMALALVFLMVYSALSSCFFQRIPKQPLILITTLIYIVPTIALFWQLRLVEKSEWGQNILNGITFREPFPPARDFSMLYRETSANMGPTTIPERTDVLIGTRLSSPVLGSMRQWLDYHPGNVVYRSALSTTAKVFRSYSGLPFAFQNAVIEQVIDASHGRMLIQDWQTGYWQVLDEIARHRRTVDNVVATGNKMLSVVSLAIDELMAHFRFEVPFRESALAYQTQVMLIQWKKMLYSMELNQVSKKNAKQMYFQHAKEQERLSAETNTSSLPYAVTRTTQVLPQAAPKLFRSKRTPQAAFRIGDTVMTEENRGLSRATILDIRHTGNGALVFDIGYERGEDEDDTPMHELRPIEPMLSGMEIRCRRNGVVSDAIIHVVKPDFSMDVKFQSDGAIYEDMHECFMKPKI